MKLFLAGLEAKKDLYEKCKPIYALQSFYYVKDWTPKLIAECKIFLLDSGAFTFMTNSKKAVDFDEYMDRYIEYINEHNIKYFFELDIDSVVGYEKVKQMRKRLEQETGKKCIPVWHKSRGLNEYIKMCKEYDYIAIGGLVSREIKPNEYPFLQKLVKLAKQYGTKVHGLGFTRKEAIEYGFFSADSTSWNEAQKYGTIKYFDGKTMKTVKKPKGTRAGGSPSLRLELGLKEWVKYQKYLDSKGVKE